MALPGVLSPAFADLLGFRVQEVLLVLSHYDSFVIAEDGQLNDRVLSEFLELNLRLPPSVTQVSTGAEALHRLRPPLSRYELVVAPTHLGDMDVCTFARRLRESGRDTPVVLFGYDSRALHRYLERHGDADLEKPFVWQGDVNIFLAIVKHVEDARNAPQDTGVSGVPAILLIEDSIRYYSSFLPVAYHAVIEQTRKLIPEGLSLSEKFYRIKTRPKILLCNTYEEAWEALSAYPDQILGVISDVEYPREGRIDRGAGERFVKALKAVRPDIPVILHSSVAENEAVAGRCGADFLRKGSPDLLRQIGTVMRQRFHFGDFVFRMPDGREIGRASDLEGFRRILVSAPRESIVHHARRNELSHWLMAHGELALARTLRDVKISDYSGSAAIGADVAKRIRRRQRERSRSVVADFPSGPFEPQSSFLRLGGGSVGGKGRGLAFMNSILDRSGLPERYPDVAIVVPQTVVLGTDVFDRFMEENDLLPLALDIGSDEELRERFQRARFPEDTVADLTRFAEAVRYPVAVRSSSLLEDSPSQPFSGVYETVLIGNQAERRGARLGALLGAIKRIYASLFRPGVRRFFENSPYRLEEEKMAVILQRVIGRPRFHRFYPDIAGTARSLNPYPRAPLRAADGIAAVALGLGEYVTQGGSAVCFSPRHPRRAIGTAETPEVFAQRDFLALDLSEGGEADADVDFLRLPISVAETDGALALLGSTWSREDDAIHDGLSRRGTRLVTLAPLLKAPGVFPLANILRDLLDLGEEACRAPVELEFAATLPTHDRQRREFGFIQLKRLQPERDAPAAVVGEIPGEHVLCRSEQVLGLGRMDGIRDLVVVDRDGFERLDSRAAAAAIRRMNGEMRKDDLPYVLIGVGRWGSRDPFLGIPVGWEDVSAARVIVEAGFRDLIVTPSHGSHFFENLVSNGVGYFVVNPDRNEGRLDWDWLLGMKPAAEEGAVRRLRLDEPLVVLLSGSEGGGWILKPSYLGTDGDGAS